MHVLTFASKTFWGRQEKLLLEVNAQGSIWVFLGCEVLKKIQSLGICCDKHTD